MKSDIIKALKNDIDESTANLPTRKQIEAVVRDFVKSNPEIVVEALNSYRTKQFAESQKKTQETVDQLRATLENNKKDPVIGNANAKIKVIEFFDYYCGYCRKMLGINEQILSNNPDIQFIFKELPILGESSKKASRAAIAINMLDESKYKQFQKELLNLNEDATDELIKSIVRKIGIDVDNFSKALQNPEIDAILQDNIKVATQLELHGTPSYIIGGKFYPGALSDVMFQQAIDEARTKNTSTSTVPNDKVGVSTESKKDEVKINDPKDAKTPFVRNVDQQDGSQGQGAQGDSGSAESMDGAASKGPDNLNPESGDDRGPSKDKQLDLPLPPIVSPGA